MLKKLINATIKRTSDIKSSGDLEKEHLDFIYQLEKDDPILIDFSYGAKLRCGTGFKFKEYSVEVNIKEVTRVPLYFKCEVCGKDVRMYNIEDIMGNSLNRRVFNTMYNEAGLNGHSLSVNVDIPDEVLREYDKIDSRVVARNAKILTNHINNLPSSM